MVLWQTSAQAHPHVWVNVICDVVFGADGKTVALKHKWTFDPAYSSYAVQGLDTNKDGIFSRDELADLAKTNTESLSEFGFFTNLKADGKAQDFDPPTDPVLEYDKGLLTLSFTLPLKQPAASKHALSLDVFDPTYFVDFTYTEGDDAVVLSNAPKGCAVQMNRPKKQAPAPQTLSEDYFANIDAGIQFASKVIIACP